MKRKVNFRRGATLAELSITLAVIAIVAVSVVSFCMVMSRQVSATKLRQNARDELVIVEGISEAWVENLAALGASPTSGDEQNQLEFKLGETKYALSFSDNILTGFLSDGKSLTQQTRFVESVSFAVMQNEMQTDWLIFCTVEYRLAQNEDVNSYTFCMNSHIGDQYPGGAVG